MALKILSLNGVYDTRLYTLIQLLAQTVQGVVEANADIMSQTLTLKIEGRNTEDAVREIVDVLKREFPAVSVKWMDVSRLPEQQAPPRPSSPMESRQERGRRMGEQGEEKEEQSAEKLEPEKERAKKKPKPEKTPIQWPEISLFLLMIAGLVFSAIFYGLSTLAGGGSILSSVLYCLSFVLSCVCIVLMSANHPRYRFGSLLTALISLILLLTNASLAVPLLLIYHAGMLGVLFFSDRFQLETDKMIDIAPESILRTRDGETKAVSYKEILPGDQIRVDGGSTISFDGMVREGVSEINRFLLTGNADSLGVQVGSMVKCGDYNITDSLTIEVSSPQQVTVAAKLRRIMLEMRLSPAMKRPLRGPWMSLFITAECLLALLVAYLLLRGLPVALWVQPALLLVAALCPCGAFGMTRLLRLGGIGNALQKGILIGGEKALDDFAHIGTVTLGYAGTLTNEDYQVVAIRTAGDHSEREVLEFAVCVESQSSHPIAKAIRECYRNESQRDELPDRNVSMVEEFEGAGVRAMIGQKITMVGNRRFMQQIGADIPEGEEEGICIYVAVRNEYIGMLVLLDPLVPEAKEIGRRLHGQGAKVNLLTNCDESVGRAVQMELELDESLSEQPTANKVVALDSWMLQEHAQGRELLYVDRGDEPPVFQCACAHAVLGADHLEATLGVAGVCIPSGKLEKVPELLEISRRTRFMATFQMGAFFVAKLLLLFGIAFWDFSLYTVIPVNIGFSVFFAAMSYGLIHTGGKQISAEDKTENTAAE